MGEKFREISSCLNNNGNKQNKEKDSREFILSKYTLERIHDFYILILKQNFSKKRHNQVIAFLVIFTKNETNVLENRKKNEKHKLK